MFSNTSPQHHHQMSKLGSNKESRANEAMGEASHHHHQHHHHQNQASSPLSNSLPSEEIKERNKCICLVIKGLSSWLVKSTLTPKSGNSLNSLCEQVSRNKLPDFLRSQLGQQYGQVKRIIESFNRYTQFTSLNSISLSSNPNLLYMLDPTIIDEIDRNNSSKSQQSALAAAMSSRAAGSANNNLDFTQPRPVNDSIASLFKASMNLSECSTHNLLFSSNLGSFRIHFLFLLPIFNLI